ncbi:MAG TPA: hypothetical protein VL486_15540 [Verrucomicrobiae bacterium]|nr:hypothetical protein [Verrucomicrobiae bacterium]
MGSAGRYTWALCFVLSSLPMWFPIIVPASAQQLAFPGAEGFGAYALGGRGGTVYHVTNLNDSGSGSFRDAVSQPNRTVVFDVSGTINMASSIGIASSNLTIAGQTAPGDGITLKGWLTSVHDTHDVIVRYIRCRPGDINCSSFQDDAFHFDNCDNVIADHVSASWSEDEALSVTWSDGVTVQWSIISEPLNFSCRNEGSGIENHGYGSLLRYGSGGLSFHHNLYAHCWSRNPRLGDSIHLDWVNNVLYNWSNQAGYNADDGAQVQYLNYVQNYLIGGTNTDFGTKISRAFSSSVTDPSYCQIYQSNNLMDTNRNGLLDGVDRGWAAFQGTYTANSNRFAFPQVSTEGATSAYVRVLSFAGASVARDAVDARIVSNVANQTGAIINSQTEVGGWPTLNSLPAPLDTDQDGMPDFWEAALGSDMNNAADRNNLTPDGYTRLEGYLNWLAAPHARVTNCCVNVDLLQYSAGLENASCGVSSPTNGTVTLLGDGHTAKFAPTPGFSGLASFLFTASGYPGTLTGTVSVLVSPGAVPPLTPFQQWQVQYFTSTDNPDADPNADPDGDGQNNMAEFLCGTDPTNRMSVLRIVSVSRQGTDVAITWTTAGGRTNAVQATSGDANGGYTNNFADITIAPYIIIPGSGDATNNYVEVSGATNAPSRYYRIRLVP